MAQSTFDATAGNDGSGYYAHTAWPPNGGTWAADDTTSDYVSKLKTGGTYIQDVAFFRWDTSSLPDDATIDGATLKLHVVSKTDDDNYSLVGDYYDFGGEPSVAGDWIETSNPSIFTAIDLTGIATGAVRSITLTDLTGISRTGVTGIRLTLSSGTPVGNNSLEVAAAENTSSLPVPQLVVDYTPAAGGSPRARLTLTGCGA